MSVYSVIRDVATAKGKSIYRIEHDLQIANGTIGRWDRSMPRADTLQKVADYLDVTVSFILNQAAKEPAK